MVGRTILHYKITEKLGEGGMGVVYKAEDTQLRRTVALKFLPRETLDEEEVKARLIREAQAAASLDHPNICHVHGIHEEDGETFIAMAFIDGPSLAEKIKERPLPLDETLGIATQIAEALHEAHEHGVVHRDIKPQNILLTNKGQVKILDFGLAALTGRSKLTKTGTTMGTPAYMAPEQLEGKEVDRRADIWALGCVLYEMLTQKTPFDADYEQAIAYGILNEEPEPISAQRSDVSPDIDRLIAKALSKDPTERYQHADELLVDLRSSRRSAETQDRPTDRRETTAQSKTPIPDESAASDAVRISARRLRAERTVLALTGLLLLGFAYSYWLAPGESPSERPLRRFSLAPTGVTEGVISPDGTTIVYVAEEEGQRSLWLQAFSSVTPRELPGTDGAVAAFWSPDSRSVGFGTRLELKRVSLDGRDAATLCELPSQQLTRNAFLGGAWSPDGQAIVFQSGVRLYEVSTRGGEARMLFDRLGMAPHFLPATGGPPALVYSGGSNVAPMLMSLDRETGEHRELAPGYRAVYSPAGYLIYQSNRIDAGLMALPFSLETLDASGDPFPVSETGLGASVSEDGTLVYTDASGSSYQIAIRNRSGEVIQIAGSPIRDLQTPAASPDGRFLAAGVAGDIWMFDLDRSVWLRLTSDPVPEGLPVWSSSGREVYFRGRGQVLVQAADGGSSARVFADVPGLGEFNVSDDDRYLVYNRAPTEDDEGGIWYREIGADGGVSEAHGFLLTPAAEQSAAVSPNSRFVAYHSSTSGRFEVYVREFPSGAGRVQVSTAGGTRPAWSADGKQLFYVLGSALMSVDVSYSPTFDVSRPSAVFETTSLIGPGRRYDVLASGDGFVTIERAGEGDAAPVEIRIVENWYEEFRDRE